MKDHRKAEIINELTNIAIAYGNTQQLRNRISRVVLECLDEQERDTRQSAAKAVWDAADEFRRKALAGMQA